MIFCCDRTKDAIANGYLQNNLGVPVVNPLPRHGDLARRQLPHPGQGGPNGEIYPTLRLYQS
jgi:hypothetical protein